MSLKTVVAKKALERAMSLATKAVNPSPVIPLLGNILLESNNGTSRITGTNMEIGVSCEFESNGEQFQTCLPSKTFYDLVNAIYSDEVSLTMDEGDQSLCIETESSRTNMKCMAAEDFPPFPRVEAPSFIMPVVQFKEMVNRVAFAAKRDGDDQSPLSGVLLAVEMEEPEEKKSKAKPVFIMFATDGYHISFEKFHLTIGKPTSLQAIIRADILELVSRLLPNDGQLMVEITENKAMFQCEDVDIVTQLLTGNFPDHNLVSAIVPNDITAKTTVTVSTLELLRAAKQLKVFATDTNKTKMDIGGVIINYSITTQNRGDSNVEIVGVCKGDNIVIGMNVRFLLSFLEVCKTPQVVIQLKGPKEAIRFTMKDYPDYYHVIMPIQV